MNKRYTKLIKNTVVFTIGSFGSKMLTFLIVPLYTFVLTTAEYGRIDLFSTTISLMIPFTTLLVQESLVRFLPAKEINPIEAASNAFVAFVGGSILTIACYPLYIYIFNFKGYVWIYIMVLILNSYNAIYGQFLRANNQVIEFSVSGIITTVTLLLGNVYFLVFLKLGMMGYIYSIFLSQVVTAIYISIVGHTWKKIFISRINIVSLKKMLVYSIPLIPNNLMWWIMNAGDKYIINFYMGDGANGIYSLAMKIPTILSIMFTIFMQAWQLSAVEEKDSMDSSYFYDSVFKVISGILIVSTTFIILGSEFLFSKAVNSDYLMAWKYVPFLCIANLFNSFSTFAGMVYTINKKSIAAFYTTFIGAITNILFNVLLIQNYGLYGVAIGTIIGYLIVFVIRYIDAKRDLGMTFVMPKIIFSVIILIIQGVVAVLVSGRLKYIFMLVSAIVIVFIHRECFRQICKWGVTRVKKKD